MASKKKMQADVAQKPAHEQQVHRIEPERQKEELHRTQLELEQAQKALHTATQLNQQIMAGAREGIIVRDRDLRTVGLNAHMEELTGKTAAELVGTLPWEVFPHLQTAGVKQHLQQVLEEGTRQLMDFHFYAPETGRSVWTSFNSSPLRDAGGEITGVVSIINDITERKRVEERIAQLNRAQAILAGIDRAIVHISDRQELLDEICRITVEKGGFKLAWIGMIGADRSVEPMAQAGATGYLDGIRVLTDDVPEGRGPIGLAIRKGEAVVIEEGDRDARMAPWQDRMRQFGLRYVAAFPIRIAGKVAGSFQVYAREANFFSETEVSLLTQVSDDISFALTAIFELAARKRAEDALRRSENDLTNFFNQAPIGLIWLSAEGTILRANKAQMDMMGYPAQDYFGHSFTEFCVEASEGHKLLEQLAAEKTVHNFRMKRRCKDGTIRHTLVDAVSLSNEHKFLYFSVFLRDISDRVKLEGDILMAGERESQRIAQDLHDELGQLLAGTAHMANTLHKNLAAKSCPEARQSERILKLIYEAIEQARNLSHSLHPVEPERNGLMAALDALAVRTKSLFQVTCRFTCKRPVLIADSTVTTHLYRIAQEAVSNAVKHGKPGRIEIVLSKTPERIVLAIKDNGAGIAARRRNKAGIGLRIMRYRAGMMSGSLSIQNRAGGGTAVVCTVPPPRSGHREAPPQGRMEQVIL